MTSKEKPDEHDKDTQVLEEICENTRAIRRATNGILDHLHEYEDKDHSDYDPDSITWGDLYNNDDMYT